jgi:hypothetical protein
MKHNNQAAFFQGNPPERNSLAWHYEMTVYENMCVMFIQAAGGAQNIPWHGGSNAVSPVKDSNKNPNTNHIDHINPEQTAKSDVTSSALAHTSQSHPYFYAVKAPPSPPSPNDSTYGSYSPNRKRELEDSDSKDWQYDFTAALDRRLHDLAHQTEYAIPI